MNTFHFMYYIDFGKLDAGEPMGWTVELTEAEKQQAKAKKMTLHNFAKARAKKEIAIDETGNLLRMQDGYTQARIGVNHLHEYLTEKECASYNTKLLAEDPNANKNPFQRGYTLVLKDAVECDECGELCAKEDAERINGSWVCPDCLSNNYVTCDGCGEYFHEEDLVKQDDGSLLCESCAQEAADE